ncbi:Ectonucleoside triphosphate diphosphohydrolase 5 [Mizuhopecten yessoensis]|uniref:Ectonucleoside triphosphate diphosphohydrolase 5 n=1 Tax=Mizuhopecten yessoensis TaxID=6573 RepID=A0A210PZE1_MIZYE|nr:Ectonucleoside triphosphate diphosphohydrolase 5 [Mizuhopecten yessoensis]
MTFPVICRRCTDPKFTTDLTLISAAVQCRIRICNITPGISVIKSVEDHTSDTKNAKIFHKFIGDMFPGAKVLTMYEVKGRVLGLCIVVAVVIFIIIMSGYNRVAKVDPQIKPGLVQWSAGPQKDFQFSGQAIANDISEDIYAIVFDAGSTGSRIHILQFKSKGKGKSLVLVSEKFDHVKPGLSSYGHDPVQGAESLRKMLNLALSVVPSSLQHDTPITLKATAGLRLLPEKNSTEILKSVRHLFREYHFLVPDDAVMIMDGVDEGVLSWMTVNFLLGRLKAGSKTVAALDLGGGSTQITFNPTEQSTFSSVPQDFIKTVQLFKKQHVLYTHSYLGLGLKAARFSILGGPRKGQYSRRLFLEF